MSEEMKKCPACAEEIKKEAKKCPKCQKDLRNWFNKHPIITILIALFILGSFFSSQEMENYENTSSDTSTVNNINGIWVKNFYVDNFGDKTNESYIVNKSSIYGTFSNSATQNSKLKIDLLIDSPEKISIQLFEYGLSNPVKEFNKTPYLIDIKTLSGKVIKLKGYNSSDRIRLTTNDAKKLYELLKKGEKLKFSIFTGEYTTSTYNFELNPKGFNNIIL